MKSDLEFPLGLDPAPGQAVPVAERMLWARLPVPGQLRHVNVWLLDEGDAWSLVDTGLGIPESLAAWEGPLAGALGGRPIRRVVCTHHHPDHAGLASHFAGRDGAEVLMSAGEHAIMRRIERAWHDDAVADARLATIEGEGAVVDGEMRAFVRLERYRTVMSGIPGAVTYVDDGAELELGGRPWRVRIVGGHTDAQLVLFSAWDGLLISGDQVLPRITSNVGMYPERGDADPVDSYVRSFDLLDRLPEDVLVLPAHGNPFCGLHVRTADLRAHHRETLAQIAALLDVPQTAAELAKRLFTRPLDALNTYLAIGETLAHLRRLVATGDAVLEPGPPNRYRRA